MLSRFLVHGVHFRDIAKIIMHIVFAHVEFRCVFCCCCWVVFWASSVFSTSRTNEQATVMQPFSCISRCANAFNAGSHCYTPVFFSIRCISIVFVSLIHIAFLVRSENPGKCQQKTNTILIYHALLRPKHKMQNILFFPLKL